MAIKSTQLKIQGMQKDLSESSFNPQFAFHNMNIRIESRDSNTLFNITNEKGNKFIKLIDQNDIETQLDGVVIGYSILNEELILFNTGDKDIIYKLWFKEDNLVCKVLYSGNLNFNIKHPIKTLAIYENENIQKIYWTDGINQPRFINIALSDEKLSQLNDDSFDFVQTLKLKENITVERDTSGSGIFHSGIVQYAFTYYNKHGQESNIFHTTPLYYTSFTNRGANPEDTVTNSFNIRISNIDYNFDYIRIYRINRTSLDGQVTVRNIIDLPLIEDINNPTLLYVDNGIDGVDIDPTLLLYVGGEEITYQTMTQKDNTLFFGNIEIKRNIVSENIKSFFRNSTITFKPKLVNYNLPSPKGYYAYTNNLNHNSNEIKTFKYLEWYRFGIQAQHKSGKISEAIFINDVQNNIPPNLDLELEDDKITLTKAIYELLDPNIIKEFYNNGYVKIRPIVVYPTNKDRDIILQGMLCPTLYNIGDRANNAPFSISSWFTRPALGVQYDADSLGQNTIYYDSTLEKWVNNINKGAWAEFRHNYALPSYSNRNAEIQLSMFPPSNINVYSEDPSVKTEWIARNSEHYCVDTSIVTLHSPDIEFDDNIRNIDMDNAKMRIVGYIPLTSHISDIDITTSSAQVDLNNIGFYKEIMSDQNLSLFGSRSMINAPFWFDGLADMKDLGSLKDKIDWSQFPVAYVIYPWHRNGSLNNDKPGAERTAMLDKKKMSNLKYSYKTLFLKDSWEAEVKNDDNHNGITNVSIFDSNEVTNIRIRSPKNSSLPDLNYYGNIDKVLKISKYQWDETTGIDINGNWIVTNRNKTKGYPICIADYKTSSSLNNYFLTYDLKHRLFSSTYTTLESGVIPEFPGKPGWPWSTIDKFKEWKTYTNTTFSTDPIRIKYKSTPHAVFGLNYTLNGKQLVLPTIRHDHYGNINYVGKDETKPFWGDVKSGVIQDTVNIDTNKYGFLWLGEIYRDVDPNYRFGGQSENAFINNIWLPCGEFVSLLDNDGNLKSNITLEYIDGDTFYQRYDCLKTYPFTQEDQNQIVDIVSFMVETRVNIDGRYDRNRGQNSNLNMTPTNFNLLNKVYSQSDNFFNYRSLDDSIFNINYFPNTISWTKTKTMGEIIDQWTNITLANVLDLDGDKGRLESLQHYNNEIFAFQDTGISHILFNSRNQIPVSDGMPIEIANSGKVDGKRYISNKVGTTNEWNMVQTYNGIYFIDNTSKVIYLFNGQINNISDKLGFHSWSINNIVNLDSWNPDDYNNFTCHYDAIHKDVYFVCKDLCLCYSELLNQFTSFFNYEGTPFMFNINNKFISFNKDNKTLWEHNVGRYNEFYGVFKPYYTTWLLNPDMSLDKWFSTIEFRSDMYDENGDFIKDKTFNKITSWNEYQYNEEELVFNKILPSNLKRKFRMWRANIPRDKNNISDPMRNSWIYLQLKSDNENYNRNNFHDLIVNYIIK